MSMNKRGQEGGASASTIVGWVILAILLVIIVLALSGFFNPLLDKLNLLPGSGVAALVKACDSYVQVSSKTDYCNFREVAVNDEKQYVNCAAKVVQDDMEAANRGAFTCASDAERNQCVALLRQAIRNPIVVGALRVDCYNAAPVIDCKNDLNGDPSINGNCPVSTGAASNTKPITINSRNDATSICCIAPTA